MKVESASARPNERIIDAIKNNVIEIKNWLIKQNN